MSTIPTSTYFTIIMSFLEFKYTLSIFTPWKACDKSHISQCLYPVKHSITLTSSILGMCTGGSRFKDSARDRTRSDSFVCITSAFPVGLDGGYFLGMEKKIFLANFQIQVHEIYVNELVCYIGGRIACTEATWFCCRSKGISGLNY